MTPSVSTAPPRLIGVGVGPGDPELITVKAIRMLREADVVLAPVMGDDVVGRAESTVRAHLSEQDLRAGALRRVVFALNEREHGERREAAWDAAAAAVVAAFDDGAASVAFATIGDPNLYSTFTYLAASVRQRRPDVEVETVPGIPAMLDLAARSGTVLAEGTEPVLLLPVTGGIPRLAVALADPDISVVAYKGGRHLAGVLAVLAESGRLSTAVYGSALGLPEEDVRPAADVQSAEAPYLSTVLAPALRSGRGTKL